MSWSDFEDDIISRSVLQTSLGDWSTETSTPVLDDQVREVPTSTGGFSDTGGEFRSESVDETSVPPRLRSRTRATRLNATAFFLTYSQSKLRKEEVTNWYQRQPRIKRMICATEHHRDGNVHYHVFVEYENKKDISTKYFDILREHPNIGIWVNRVQTYDEWCLHHWNYCLKEDENCFTIGEKPELRKRKRDEVATECRKRACETGVADAMSYLAENAAWEHMTKYDQIMRALMSMRNANRKPDPPRPLSSFKDLPIIVDSWRNLYICGPTGSGKTAWARSLLPEATVISHRDQLRDCDFSKGVIFDDFEVSHWPPTAVIHLLDWEEPRGLDVKHGHVVIPPRTRKIFTHNSPFEDWIPQGDDKIPCTSEQKAAMRRRVNVVKIYHPLF